MGAAGHCSTATLNNGLGQYSEALMAARRALNALQELGFSMLVLPEVVEAASRSGNTRLATDALEQLSKATLASGTDWALGIEARCRALLSEQSAAEPHYQQAIVLLNRTEVRFDLARAHLVYGEWLRRVNQRVTARQQLRIAHKIFIEIGAETFAERARRELLATGETVRKRSVDTVCELTAQEAQIAQLASFGCTNREIGTELFISARTVEWHLRKVYQKLGLGSRRELRNLRVISQPARLSSDLVSALG